MISWQTLTKERILHLYLHFVNQGKINEVLAFFNRLFHEGHSAFSTRIRLLGIS